MANSAIGTSTHPHELLVYLDWDEPQVVAYEREMPVRQVCGLQYWNEPKSVLPHWRTAFMQGAPDGVGRAWNRLARRCTGDWLMMANDDLVFHTYGWDEKLLEALHGAWDDRLFVAWADDDSGQAAERCAFPIVSRQWYETLGYFTPECFSFLWHDTWIHDIGRRMGRTLYVPNVKIEHRHFAFRKAEYDETYRRHRVGSEAIAKRARDAATFRVTAKERQAHAERLLAKTKGGKQ